MSYFKSVGEFVFLMNVIDDLIDSTHRLRLFVLLLLPRLSLLSKTCLRDEILVSIYSTCRYLITFFMLF